MLIASRRVYYTVIFILSVSVAVLVPHTILAGDETPSGVKIKTFEIEYGSGKEQVGAYNDGEGALKGPESFTVDNEGNIHICDTVNRRIQIYSPDGAHVSTNNDFCGGFVNDENVGLNGRRYLLRSKRFQGIKIEIREQDGTLLNTIHFDLKGLTSMQFLGDDSDENLYIETGRWGNESRIAEIHKISSKGELLRTIRLQDVRSHFKAKRSFVIGRDGTVYQFLRKRNKAIINIYSPDTD